jgi:hypothetical protein
MKNKNQWRKAFQMSVFTWIQYLVFFFILAGVALYEAVRWEVARHSCIQRQMGHLKVLESDVCNGRHHYGTDFASACAQAELELAIPVVQCTAQNWWKTGEVYRLYSHYSESYALMFGLPLCLGLYLLHKLMDQRHAQPAVSFVPIPMLQGPQQQQQRYPVWGQGDRREYKDW